VERLNDIKDFLYKNRKYNKELQIRFALGSVGQYEKPFDKLVALLYDTVNTQSQPNIDNLAKFFQKIYKNKEKLDSFDKFVEYICNSKVKTNKPYESLYEGLKKQKGWGSKTSALVIKNIYNYHHIFNNDKLIIWDDVPKLEKDDKLFLPVDIVIKTIFNKLDNSKTWDFEDINEYLNNFSNEDIILFDDLWFWGYITQKGTGENRVFVEWNNAKYWMIKESIKDEKTIEEIKGKAEEFLNLIGQKVQVVA